MAEVIMHCEILNRQSKDTPHGILTINFTDREKPVLTAHRMYQRQGEEVNFTHTILILPRTDEGGKRAFLLSPSMGSTRCADVNGIIREQLEKMGQFSQANIAFDRTG